jgi:hypothetical protein
MCVSVSCIFFETVEFEILCLNVCCLNVCASFQQMSFSFLLSFIYTNAPEGCRHGTHTNATAYIRGTYSRSALSYRGGPFECQLAKSTETSIYSRIPRSPYIFRLFPSNG